MKRVMRIAQRAVTDAAADADQLDIHFGISDVDFDLFETSCAQETGWCTYKNLLAECRKSRCNAHLVLFGDPDF